MVGSRARSGFSLLEVIFAVAVAATALLALQAAVSGGILSAADSVTRRSARLLAKAKMEEILAGVASPDEGGAFEQDESVSYTASTEELQVGVESVGRTEVVRIVRLEVNFTTLAGGENGSRAVIKMTGILPPEETQ